MGTKLKAHDYLSEDEYTELWDHKMGKLVILMVSSMLF